MSEEYRNNADMARLLVDTFGYDNEFRIKEAHDQALAMDDVHEGRYVTLVRKYGEKSARGIFWLPADFEQRVANNTKANEAPKRKAAAQPAASVPNINPVAEEQEAPAVQETETRSFSRINSGDLTYEPLVVPEKNKDFQAFGCFKTVKDILKSGVFAPLYIVGDSGYGKTLSVEQACAQTKRPLVMFNITNETCEDDLIGGLRIVDGDSVFEYGPVIRAYKEGAVLLLDELDQGTSQVMCLQTIMQRKPYYIKKTGETIYPHPDFMVFATGNTKGLGDDYQGKFQGAQMLNEAFLERFSGMLEQEPPTQAVEKKILGRLCDDEEFNDHLVQWANMTREAASTGAGGVKRPIQTRRLVHIVTNYQALGNKEMAIKLALGRFDPNTARAMGMLYTKIDASLNI